MAITDLTNTLWKINETPTIPSTSVNYSINFASNETTFTGISLGSTILYIGKAFVPVYRNGTWDSEAYRIIEITGGTDATNADLIAWLQANAVLAIEAKKLLWNGSDEVVAKYAINDSHGTSIDMNSKVDKVTGKGLSTNDYTTTEKNKLAGIASSAQVNVIETVQVNGNSLTPSSKAVNINIPLNQTQVSIVTDSLHNINGYAVKPGAFSAERFVSTDSTITTGGKTYTVKIIQDKLGSGTPSNLTESQSKKYMQQMCGSSYVSKYDEDLPHDHIFMMADFTLWKPQWDSTNGLVLWKLSEVQKRLYRHKIWFNVTASTTTYGYSVDIIMPTAEEVTYSNLKTNESLRTYISRLIRSVICNDENDNVCFIDSVYLSSNNLYLSMRYRDGDTERLLIETISDNAIEEMN